MNTLNLLDYAIEIGQLQSSSFEELLNKYAQNAKIAVLTDENVYENWGDWLVTSFPALDKAGIIVLPAGEENKTLEICIQVWETLTESELGRHDLLVNFGGGVITDLGGFVASTFKRGMNFVNIPTSLLGMVDASVGSKTGVNLQIYKNQIGAFANPEAIYIDKQFLTTLPEDELKSGLAEVLKHALIKSENLWKRLTSMEDLRELFSDDILSESVEIKAEIVKLDPKERGIRKILNFGHTIGHALEGFFMHKNAISHGHAVALGIIAESYVATRLNMMDENTFSEIETQVLRWFKVPEITQSEIPEIVELTHNDKKNYNGNTQHDKIGTRKFGIPAPVELRHNDGKNYNGKIQCSLVDKIGSCQFDIAVDTQLLAQSLEYLMGK